VEEGSPVMYLPLDKMLERGKQPTPDRSAAGSSTTPSADSDGTARSAAGRDRLRNREIR
jgi:hypothetical protein